METVSATRAKARPGHTAPAHMLTCGLLGMVIDGPPAMAHPAHPAAPALRPGHTAPAHMLTCGLLGMVIDSTDNDKLNFELGRLFPLIPVQKLISDSICQLLEMMEHSMHQCLKTNQNRMITLTLCGNNSLTEAYFKIHAITELVHTTVMHEVSVRSA